MILGKLKTLPKKSILLNTDEVNEILSSTTLIIRRELKPDQYPKQVVKNVDITSPEKTFVSGVQNRRKEGFAAFGSTKEECLERLLKLGGCGFGKVNDKLWVKETFLPFDADWRYPGRAHDLTEGPWPKIAYKANEVHSKPKSFKWRPPAHMPQWASRLTVEISNIEIAEVEDGSKVKLMYLITITKPYFHSDNF